MSHIAFVPFSGLRCRESEMLELGMTLPGLSDRASALNGLPSLGLLTLAGMTSNSWSTSYHPSAQSDSLVEDVLATNPTLVAISALTASVTEAYAFSAAIRQQGVKTVIGGLHATVLPEEALENADAVCVGDGEASWMNILDDLQAGTLRSIYRPASPFALAESPMPRFDMLGDRVQPRWTLQTQRGCPWACEFCGASRLLGPPRFKPIVQVESELRQLKRIDQSPWIELADDNTFAGRKDQLDLLAVIEQFNVRYFTESDWRIGEDPQLVKAIANSGCVQVLVGLESMAFRYPGMGKKFAELERMMAAIEVIQDAGIVVNGCFIVGADGETDQSLDRLVDFINASSLAEVQLTLQTPFPGTGLYRRMHQAGRILSQRDWSFYTLFDVVFQPDQMSVTDLEKGFRRVMAGVFAPSESKRRAKIRRDVWRKNFCMRSKPTNPFQG